MAPERHGLSNLRGRLYAIADAECLGTDREVFASRVAAVVRGGIRTIQLRLKPTRADLAADDLWRHAMIETTLHALAAETGEVMLWLDDRADLAACFPGAFAGVHVGQDDLPAVAVRSVLGSRILVGLSCHDLAQVTHADEDPAVDWVAIGPVFATTSKVDADPVVGLAGVRAVRAATLKPLVAIGGVSASRIPLVLEAGADMVVVLSALVEGGCHPSAVERQARTLVEIAHACGESAS